MGFASSSRNSPFSKNFSPLFIKTNIFEAFGSPILAKSTGSFCCKIHNVQLMVNYLLFCSKLPAPLEPSGVSGTNLTQATRKIQSTPMSRRPAEAAASTLPSAEAQLLWESYRGSFL